MAHPGFVGADPDQLEAFAHRLSAAADHIDEVRATLGRQLDRTYWEGPEGDDFRADWRGHHTWVLTSAAAALRTAADRVRGNADEQRGVSRADTGTLAGGAALYFGLGSAAPDEVRQFWESLSQQQQMALLNLDFIKGPLQFLGLLPGDDSPAAVTGWAVGLAVLTAGAGTSWVVRGHYRFKPRWPKGFPNAGAYMPVKDLSFWQRYHAALESKNWTPKGGGSSSLPKWEAAGRWIGGIGAIATAGVTAWQQWEVDAQDPSLDTEAKIARAAWSGATTAAYAWAGAETFAYIGGGIGTAICPGIGTVVGGVVGGLVGGAIGAFVGHEIGQVMIDAVGDAASAVGDVIGDVASTVGDWLDDAGEGLAALKFW